MHEQAFDYVKKTVKKYGPFKSVLDIGGRNVNGSPKELFPNASYLTLDIVPGHEVDIVADAADWTPDQKFDCVITTETFEHTPRVEEIIQNIARMLKPGGRVIITCASSPRMPHSGIDGGRLHADEYYSNVEPESMYAYLEDARFFEIEVTKRIYPNHGGDLYATGLKE